jgi:hypothetical protein
VEVLLTALSPTVKVKELKSFLMSECVNYTSVIEQHFFQMNFRKNVVLSLPSLSL